MRKKQPQRVPNKDKGVFCWKPQLSCDFELVSVFIAKAQPVQPLFASQLRSEVEVMSTEHAMNTTIRAASNNNLATNRFGRTPCIPGLILHSAQESLLAQRTTPVAMDPFKGEPAASSAAQIWREAWDQFCLTLPVSGANLLHLGGRTFW